MTTSSNEAPPVSGEVEELVELPGVDAQVMLAAVELDDTQRGQPEWLWFENDDGRVSFGRWQKAPEQAPYVRADIIASALTAANADRDRLARELEEAREALKAEDAADAAFDAADEYTHRADAEDWLNDPTGSMHVNGAWDRANGLRAKAKELRRAALASGEAP